MITIEHPDYESKLQRLVFIRPGSNIDPETNLPFLYEDFVVINVEDLVTIGVPMDTDNEEIFELWAVLEPGENLPEFE